MMSDAPQKPLTPKQKCFVEQYLLDLNATQAAVRAGYSARTANEIAAQLLGKPHVRAAIDAAKADRSTKIGVDAAWMLERLVLEAEADISDLYHSDGTLRPVEDWPLIWRQGLVQGIEVEELFDGHGKDRVQIGHLRKVKLDSRIRRLELIGRHINVQAFRDQIALEGLDSLAERLSRAAKRAAGEDLPVIPNAPPVAPSLPAAPVPATATPTPAAPAAPPEPPPKPAAPPVYRPILPPFPEGPKFARTDYDPFSD